MIEALSLPDPVRLVGAGAGLLAAAGLLLLLPLWLSQRRDLRRLRAWHSLEPERGDAAAPIGPAVARAADDPATAGSATSVGAAATATATTTGEPTVESPAAPPPAAATDADATTERRTMTPAERVTADRPALERITMEHAALEQESGVHKIWSRVSEPRHPLFIGAGALLVALGIIVGSLQLLIGGDGGGSGQAGDVNPEEVSVTVVNATEVADLLDDVSATVEANGFSVEGTATTEKTRNRTIVMFAQGQQAEARSVAEALGVRPKDVRPLAGEAERAADGAGVVVLAGEDRARVAGGDPAGS